MESRATNLKLSNSQNQLSLPHIINTENPVLSPRSNISYYPLSRASSRKATLSKEGFGIIVKQRNYIEKKSQIDLSDIDNYIDKLLKRSKGSTNCTRSLIKHIKILKNSIVDVLHPLESLALAKCMQNIVVSIDEIFDYLEKQRYAVEKASQELIQQKSQYKETSLLNKQLKQQLQGAIEKLSNSDKVKLDNVNNIENQSRKYLLEKEKLIEKVSMLEDYINELKDVTKIEIISSNLDQYKDLYEKTNTEYKNFVKEKNAQIYKLQVTIGLLKEAISKNDSFMNNFQQTQSIYEEKLRNADKNEINLKQIIREHSERLCLFREDVLRFIEYKDRYNSIYEQLNNLKNKHQQLELNIIAGNTSANTDGAI